MDFLSLAKEIERQGYEYYMALADATPIREVAGIFRFLAEEELKHYDAFESLKKDVPASFSDDAAMSADTPAAEPVMELFRGAEHSVFNYEEAYKKATELENRSIQFYTKALNSDELLDESTRRIIAMILAQEEKHVWLVNSFMEFLRHAGEWLENAEWHHSDTY